jgi:hypothetical protein
MSYKSKRGTFRKNRNINIGAPDIVTAIRGAMAELLVLLNEEVEDVLVTSASHRGPIHRVVSDE